MALACCEAGARVVYCFDLPEKPSDEWVACRDYVAKLGNNSRLEYFSASVTDQESLCKKAEEIGDKEGRMDFCVAAAGVLRSHIDCLEYPAEEFREVSGKSMKVVLCRLTYWITLGLQVLEVNTTGVLFTAQAAGRQMARFGNGGSIILVASMSGSITNRVRPDNCYNHLAF